MFLVTFHQNVQLCCTQTHFRARLCWAGCLVLELETNDKQCRPWSGFAQLWLHRAPDSPVTHRPHRLHKRSTAVLQSYLSGPHLTLCIIVLPPSLLLHLSSLLYFHALSLCFTATIENWVITSWRLCSKVSPPPSLFLSVLPASFPPLPFGRPLIQHAQRCIPQTVGAPSNAAAASLAGRPGPGLSCHRPSAPGSSPCIRDLWLLGNCNVAATESPWWQGKSNCSSQEQSANCIVLATFKLLKPTPSKTLMPEWGPSCLCWGGGSCDSGEQASEHLFVWPPNPWGLYYTDTQLQFHPPKAHYVLGSHNNNVLVHGDIPQHGKCTVL